MSVDSTTIDDEEIPKTILNLDCIYLSPTLQEAVYKIASNYKANQECLNCFLSGLQFSVVLLYKISRREVLILLKNSEKVGESYRNCYINVNNLYINCANTHNFTDSGQTCTICIYFVIFEYKDFVEAVLNLLDFRLPFGFIRAVMYVYFNFLKRWNTCKFNCIPRFFSTRSSFEIKTCL